MQIAYLYMFVMIVSEVIGTMALQASQQFTRPLPSLIVVIGYGLTFYFMALTLKYMPVGIVYAIWSGLGIVGITVLAYFLFGQKLDLPAIIGIALIISGVLVMHLFSNATTH